MSSEYRLDYRKARRNRFASKLKGRTVAVVLEPDVAAVFESSESVNSALRSVLSALPERLREEATHYGVRQRAPATRRRR